MISLEKILADGTKAYRTLRGGGLTWGRKWMKCIINELNMSWQQWNGISLSAGGMSHTNY